MVNLLHECETPDTNSLDYISICCGAERNEYAENFCGQCNEATTFECVDCGKPETTTNIIFLESSELLEFIKNPLTNIIPSGKL